MTPRRNHRGAEPHPTFSPRPPSRFALRRIRAKRLTVAIALLFALSLTACDTTRSEPRKRHITVGITAVGGPLDATGSRHPQTVLLEVRDENDDLVNFDAELVADRRGSATLITLPPDKPSVTIQLPIGKAYVLVARGYDTSENQLTFGETTVTAGAAPTAVIVQLHTLLGSGRLVPRLPINHLVPGQTLDLIHIASPNGRTDLHVPEHELDVTYDGNVEVITFSPRGARVNVGARQDGDAIVTATAHGMKLTEEGARPGVVTSTFTRPFITGIQADVSPPIVKGVSYDSQESLLTGLAYDDWSLQRLEIYDGPQLLATTDPEQAVAKVVPIVAFPEGESTFLVRLPLPPGEHELNIIATDLAGNQVEHTFEALIR